MDDNLLLKKVSTSSNEVKDGEEVEKKSCSSPKINGITHFPKPLIRSDSPKKMKQTVTFSDDVELSPRTLQMRKKDKKKPFDSDKLIQLTAVPTRSKSQVQLAGIAPPDEKSRSKRRDAYGTEILKDNKKHYKVSFLDQISEKKFADVIIVEHLKEENTFSLPNDKVRAGCCSCEIY